MNPQVTQVNLQEMSNIAQIFEKILSKGLGPQGSQTLLSTVTGQIMATNNGMTILNTLNISHPIGKLMTESLRRTVSYTGDGSKAFVLYLSKALQLIAEASPSSETSHRIQHRQALQYFLTSIYPSFVHHMLQHSKRVRLEAVYYKDDMSHDTKEYIKAIFRSVFSPHYPPRIVEHFVEVSLSMFRPDLSDAHLLSYTENIIINFDSLILKAPNCPYSDCRSIEPVIIHRSFATFSGATSKGMVKFCMCSYSIEGETGHENSTESLSLSSNDDVKTFLNYKSSKVMNFVRMCTEHNVNLVLSTEKISDYALDIFRQSCISVVHCILEDDIRFLQTVLHLEVISSSCEILDKRNIGTAMSCVPVLFNGQKCVHLNITRSRSLVPRMLIVAAPTEGLCHQLSLVFQKALRTLMLSFAKYLTDCKLFSDHDQFGTVPDILATDVILMPGGGTFELVGAKFLSEISKSNKKASISRICKILSDTLLTVPRNLYKNSATSVSGITSDFLVKIQQINTNNELHLGRQSSSETMELKGFSRKGNVINPLKEGVAESLNVKLHIFSAMLELLSQLLGIDGIIGIRNQSKDIQ